MKSKQSVLESEKIVPGFVGFSNSENLETETRKENQPKTQSEIKPDFYNCPNCPAQILVAGDICLSCGKRAIEF